MESISSLGIGSGLDLNGLLDQLGQAERQKLVPIADQQRSYEAKISAFGKLQGSLTKFQDAMTPLNDAALFQSVTASSSSEALGVTASPDAQPGRYDVDVTNLARAHSIASGGFAERDIELGAGTLDLDIGTGDNARSLSLTIAQADSSLEGIRDAINAENAGVTATIVNDGGTEPHRLVITADDTGTESAIQSVGFTSDGGDTALEDALTYDPVGGTGGIAETVAAENAALTVNGIAITSQSNRVEDAIQGVTLDLAAEGASTVTVAQDDEAIKEALTGFIEAYNGLKDTTANLTRFNAESGDAGQLLGDSTLRTIESRLRSDLAGTVEGSAFEMLSQIGIDLDVDGRLQLDEGVLDQAIAEQPDALADFFAGADAAGGLAGRLEATLEPMLGTGGMLDTVTDGLEGSIERLDERHQRTEQTIERTIERFRRQFSQLDGMIASMNQTSSFLDQQLANLNTNNTSS